MKFPTCRWMLAAIISACLCGALFAQEKEMHEGHDKAEHSGTNEGHDDAKPAMQEEGHGAQNAR